MELAAAESLAKELLEEHGLGGTWRLGWVLGPGRWSFGWNRRKRSLGLCRYREKRIELSTYFVRANDIGEVRETILHEIAHALAGEKAGHGPAWKAMCQRVGCKPERCDKGTAIMPTGKWRAACPECGKEYSRHRRPAKRARYWCRGCGPEKGMVVFERGVVVGG